MAIWEWATGFLESFRWLDLAISLVILAFFWLFSRVFAKSVFAFWRSRVHSSGGTAAWLEAFEKPLRVFFIVLGIYLAIRTYIVPRLETAFHLDAIFRSAMIILLGWGTYKLSAQSSVLLVDLSKKLKLDDTSMLIPFMSKVLRFLVAVITAGLVGSEWGFSVNGLVAGMGLGSLAVALAAKDTLGNIFGGIVIITEKPFSKGDWILTPSVEGVVEDITFRSTQVRTFAQAVVVVPNAKLVDQPITNWSKMGKRRVNFTLDVALDSDRTALNRAVARMKELLRHNEHIDPVTIMVNFTDFKEQSLGIFLYFFTKTTVWSEYLDIREEINFELLQVLEEEGIRLAYPMQRVFLEEQGAYYREQESLRA
ncbi:mechanosensitive ion channel protein [Paenibacillus yonginensis]|uniref:Mechanosensitive ion channel protein n=1 Tax=Paenibacillus yonginensis TaxID=1462996 RepID=A0A1B1N467_9BACL|nr:mechanosensitive ion channel family protein [Paenibacillus yonginensis]ANS76219.1 mechanosensitive ion channel protein [Paenibacillus yonginensis]